MNDKPANRHTRYQGAIINDDHILLIRHLEHLSGRTYWVIPGGGKMQEETDEECVRREMQEETHLDVKVGELLLDESTNPDDAYRRMKTYLCTPLKGEAGPGVEPEPEASSHYSIVEVRWFDLRDERDWGELLTNDHITYPLVQRIRRKMGYIVF